MEDIEYLDCEPFQKIEIASIEDILSYDYKYFLETLKYMAKEERLKLLKNPQIIDKLFLLDSFENIWEFEKVSNVYSFKDLLPIMQPEFLSKMQQRSDHKSYVYVLAFIRSNKEEFMANIFTNVNFVKFFMKNAEAIYSELLFNYDFILKLFNYCFDNNILIGEAFISVLPYSIKTKEEQKMFLKEIKNKSLIYDLLRVFDKDVSEDYIKNNIIGLSTKQIFSLMHRLNIPEALFQNKEFFNRQILNLSLLAMDNIIENLGKNNNVIYLKQIKEQMLLKILTLYDKTNKVFNYTPVEVLVEEIDAYEAFLNRYYYLNQKMDDLEKTHYLLENIVINLLFGDSLKNICLNIKEMLAFNSTLKSSFLSKEKILFYENLIKIDEWDNNEIYDFFSLYHNRFL